MLGATVVHLVRANVVDVAVFLGTSVLMLVLLRHDRPSRRPPWWLSRPWSGPAAAGLLGLVVAVQPRTSAAVQLALAVVGALVLVLVLRAGAGGPVPRTSTRRAWVWALPLLAGCLLELADFLSQPDARTDNADHPTISALVDPTLDGRPVRVAVTVVWVLVGWALVRVLTERGSRP
ncbi:hypothetical protein [Phycicoccus sp. 3266]|uniref:hypothetical protein n=1 Tax=Phycicoccus sp. 3266 TaxID=2817751 RepID=UPI002860BFB3|nr:hypothetical protein [Phycicoccus sp. 3266]MDR6861794.1 hypothetical protein [Phycicoccus sp. 3266]